MKSILLKNKPLQAAGKKLHKAEALFLQAVKQFKKSKASIYRKMGIKPGVVVEILMAPYSTPQSITPMRICVVEGDRVYCNMLGDKNEHTRNIQKTFWGSNIKDIVKIHKAKGKKP